MLQDIIFKKCLASTPDDLMNISSSAAKDSFVGALWHILHLASTRDCVYLVGYFA